MAIKDTLISAFLLISLSSSAWSQSEYRLSPNVVPEHYQVHLNFTPEVFQSLDVNDYEGYMHVTFRVLETTDKIRIHASHIFVNVTHITYGDLDLTSDQWSVDASTDIVTINLPTNVTASNVLRQLYIEFTARLSTTDMYGFYKSSYVDNNNETKYLATTQFQPVYARRVFPCFDEPSFKATFDIYITYPSDLNVLGNTPEESFNTTGWGDGVNGEFKTVLFQRTPVMSTYLLAFIISNFTCTSGEDIETNGATSLIPYRVCSRNETSDLREWAVEIGPKLLRSLNSWTGINYSEHNVDKMDQVAIPDFAAGAMENWGLVTYREGYLLWDEQHSTNSAKETIATIISHEFAHQWFGNLVTCNWWSELFLNEGFATYFEEFTTHDVLPEWELDKRFVTGHMHSALVTDSNIAAKSLQSEANSDADVSNKFDGISYSKGGSVLRMVEHIVGTDRFKAGVSEYLSNSRFGTTKPEDLWNAIDNHVNTTYSNLPANLTVVMENWVKNPGYPLLTVSRVGISYVISQERFLISGNDNTSRWYVPISYTMSTDTNKFNNTAPKEWLSPVGFVELSDLPSGLQWIIINNQETGFYRVNYNDDLWTSISNALFDNDNFDGIHESNRAQIVDDAFNLARVGKIKYSKVFEIIRFLANEVTYTPWISAINGWNFLIRRVGLSSDLGKSISTHVLQLIDKVHDSVDIRYLNESEHVFTLKQSAVLTMACRMEHGICVDTVMERFGEYRATRERPPKNIRSLIYCNGLRYTNQPNDWNIVWESYQTTDLADERSLLLSALGCTQNETHLENFLQKTLDPNSGIRSQDASTAFAAVYSNSEVGIDVAFRFLQANFDLIEDRYQSMNALNNLIAGIADRFTNEAQLQSLRQFIDTADITDSFKQAAENAYNNAQANINWLNQNVDDLREYYANTPPTTTPTPPTQPSVNETTVVIETTTKGGAVGLTTSLLLVVVLGIVSRVFG